MKFCTKCGHELLDEAVICTNCGRLVGEAPQREQVQRNVDGMANNSVLPAVFNFIFAVVTAISLFFFALSFGCSYVSAYAGKYDIRASFYLDSGFLALAFISSMTSLAFGIVSFVISLVKRLKLEQILSSITRMSVGIFLVLLSIILMGQ